MNTEINRTDAKNAIVARADADPDLDAALQTGQHLQLEVVKENNRHKEQMRGHFAKLFGSDDSVPFYIAATSIFIALAAFVGCLIANFLHSDTTFWGTWAERSISFAATCIAYIFGKASKN